MFERFLLPWQQVYHVFHSIFRTAPEVSSKFYFVEICYISDKLWLFNHKRADFWLDLKVHFSSSLTFRAPILSGGPCLAQDHGSITSQLNFVQDQVTQADQKLCIYGRGQCVESNFLLGMAM